MRNQFILPALIIAACIMIQSCIFGRNANEMPCSERCMYNYQFCIEGSSPNTAHITIPIGENDDDGAQYLTSDYCTVKLKKCMAFCESSKNDSSSPQVLKKQK